MKKEKKTGFSLAELLVILLIVGVAIAGGTKLLTKRSSSVGIDNTTMNCIFNNASDISFNATKGNLIEPLPSGGSCYAAYNGCKVNKEGACETLFFYADGAGNANQKLASLKILRAICDKGGEKACNYFILRCIGNLTNCSSPNSKYTLRYYLNLPISELNEGKTFIQTRGTEYYNWNITVFSNEINTICPECGNSTACAIKGVEECPTPPDPACGAVDIGSIRVAKCNSEYNVVANNVNPGGNGCWQGESNGCTGTGCGRTVCNWGGANQACIALNGGEDYGTRNWRLPTRAEMQNWRTSYSVDSQLISVVQTELDFCDANSGYSPYCKFYAGCSGSFDSRCYSYGVWSAESSGGLYYRLLLLSGLWTGPNTLNPAYAFSVRCVRNL